MVTHDGTLSVLLTNLFDKTEFSRESIIKLYFRRWTVEEYYRDEKVYLEVEKFHSKNCNGIRQELFAAMIMSVIARILMVLSSNKEDSQVVEPQFKNAVMTIAAEAIVLTPDKPEKAARIFKEVLNEIRRVKYYRPKKSRPSKPRVTKKAKNKWIKDRKGKLKNA